MTGWVYLIRNGGLHKIGITKNLEQKMKAFEPNEVIYTLRTEH